jgi:hypothetical protein
MKKQFDDYVLLHNGRHLGSLWLGSDHLLIIEKSSLFGSIREYYRRLDYDSIQGIFTARTSKSKVTMILVSIFAAIFGLLAAGMVSDESWGGVGVFGLITVFLLIILVVNLIRGPSSGMIILTAVRAWRVAPVDRLKVADKVFDALAAKCHEFQSGKTHTLSDDPAPIPSENMEASANLNAPPPVPSHLVSAPEERIPPHPTLLWGYATLGVAGALVGGELLINHLAYTLFMIAVVFTSFGLVFVAVSRRGGLASTGSKVNFIVSVILISLLMLAGYAVSMFGVFTESYEENAMDSLAFARHLAAFPGQGSSGGLQTLVLAAAAGCLACSVIGLFMAARRRARLAEAPPGMETSGHP